jgi:ketosteroid isomerase-like protein
MVQTSNDNGLTEQDLREYMAAFNRDDFDGFAEYYADNMIFEGRGRHFKGREEMVNFYRILKSRVRETVTIKEAAVGKNEMAVEIETELYAFEDWLAMPTGPMRKDERIRSQNFVWYEIQNNKFVHIRSAHYRRLEASEPSAVEKSSAQSPRALPPVMSKERFASYIDALNNDNYAALSDYYNDDVVLVTAGKKELHGRQAILDFYEGVKPLTKRTIQINRIITSGSLLAAELQSKFFALQDLPDFTAGPMKKGGCIISDTFVLCNVRDGKFARIRSAEFRKVEGPSIMTPSIHC